MRILGIKPGHDGSIACIEDGMLAFSYEAEKDTYFRYMHMHPEVAFEAMLSCGRPDVVAIGGWIRGVPGTIELPGEGYHGIGIDSSSVKAAQLLGCDLRVFRSTHERSHLACGFGLSPFGEQQECYVLLWEGVIGAFYKLSANGSAMKLGEPLCGPGDRLLLLYHIAQSGGDFGYDGTAGKTMALAAYFKTITPTIQESALLDRLLSSEQPDRSHKSRYVDSHLYNHGVDTVEYRRMARLLTDAIYNRFETFARVNLTEHLPLIITGGCGLNCEWNSRWRECGLFPEVFVPPCANDSGSAIGTAIDALQHLTGQRKVEWSVYSGQEFRVDVSSTRYLRKPLDIEFVARQICNHGLIVPWVQGRCEIGPRALGHRSLLALPMAAGIRDRLNDLKNREYYRPIAPVTTTDEAAKWFSPPSPSPHMLYFHSVSDRRLEEIAHVDGSARLQTINDSDCPELVNLLNAVRARTGVGVLCNTSLNFPGCGFINRLSDLDRYSADNQLTLYVAGNSMFLRPNE